jgi:hypothetical protein
MITSKIATAKAVAVALFGLLAVVGLFAQTTTPKQPVTKKPAAKVAESKAHVAIRTQYEAKIKECEQRWLDAKASVESNINKDSADVARDEAKLRLLKLQLGLTIYQALPDTPGRPCQVHPDGTMSDELDTLEKQLKYVDSCIATYRKTIDKKNADLTVRESEQVNACQSLDLYPPGK